MKMSMKTLVFAFVLIFLLSGRATAIEKETSECLQRYFLRCCDRALNDGLQAKGCVAQICNYQMKSPDEDVSYACENPCFTLTLNECCQASRHRNGKFNRKDFKRCSRRTMKPFCKQFGLKYKKEFQRMGKICLKHNCYGDGVGNCPKEE